MPVPGLHDSSRALWRRTSRLEFCPPGHAAGGVRQPCLAACVARPRGQTGNGRTPTDPTRLRSWGRLWKGAPPQREGWPTHRCTDHSIATRHTRRTAKLQQQFNYLVLPGVHCQRQRCEPRKPIPKSRPNAPAELQVCQPCCRLQLLLLHRWARRRWVLGQTHRPGAAVTIGAGGREVQPDVGAIPPLALPRRGL